MQSFASGGSVGGFSIPDAPGTGGPYGRFQGNWVEVPEEAPKDGIIYGRQNDAWVPASGGGGLDIATGDARYVNVTGDAMTGPLDIYSATSTAQINLVAEGATVNGSAQIVASGYANATSALPGLFTRFARGTVAVPIDVGLGDRVGGYVAAGWSGGAFRTVVGIEAYVAPSGTISATSLPSELAFKTTSDGSVSRTERMRINSSGQVNVLASIVSSSPTTGSLVVTGGVGVGGAINGNSSFTATGQLHALGTATLPPAVAGYTTLTIDSAAGGGAGGQLLLSNNGVKSLNLIGRSDGVFYGTPLDIPLIFQTNAGVTQFVLNNVTANFPRTIPSTSPTTGAVTIAGGVGIGGALYGKSLRIEGNVISSGVGPGIELLVNPDQAYVQAIDRTLAALIPLNLSGTNVKVVSSVASTSPTTGALVVNGGVGINGALNLNSTLMQGGDFAYLGSHNSGGIFPRSGLDLAVAWNSTGGSRDMGLWNTDTGASIAFIFNQLTGAASKNVLMTLFSNGNVGIGTTSPVINTNNSRFLTFQGAGSGWDAAISAGSYQPSISAVGSFNFFNTASVATDKRVAAITCTSSPDSGAFTFWTWNAGAVAPRMSIDTDGRVNAHSGLAASSTTTGSLVVVGGVGISGDLYTGADCNFSSAGGGIHLKNTAGSGLTWNIQPQISGVSSDGFSIADGGGAVILSIDTTRRIYTPGYIASSSPTTGAIVIGGGGGLGVGGALYTGGGITSLGEIRGTALIAGNPYSLPSGWGTNINDGSTGNAVFFDTKGDALNCRIGSSVEYAWSHGWLTVSGGTGNTTFHAPMTLNNSLTVANSILSNSDISVNRSTLGSPASGVIYFGSGAVTYLYYDATYMHLQGAPFAVDNAAVSSGPTTGALVVAGGVGVSGACHFGNYTRVVRNINEVCLQIENNNGAIGSDAVRVSMVNMTDGTSYQALAYNNAHGWRFIVRGNGNVENVNNSYGAISDVRHKKDIVNAPSMLERIMAVKVRSYHLEHDNDDAPMRVGVVSQEMEELFPELVYEDGEGKKYFEYSNLWPRMLKAFQEHVNSTRVH